jgi:hypothetical protein
LPRRLGPTLAFLVEAVVKRIPAAVLLVVLGALAPTADAIPRYSARYGQACTLCHVNPTGGGMRSLYASQFIVPKELAMKQLTDEEIAKIQPKVSESITLGTDLRSAHFHSTGDQVARNFFLMQGDLYAQFSIDERCSANIDVDQEGSVEIYALAWVLPWSGYVKAGRFTPVFGWKFPDHNLFNREELNFDQPFNTDAGIEVGFYPKHVSVWASVLNGEPPVNTRFDTNDDLAYVLGALSQFRVHQVGVGLGGSFLFNRQDPSRTSASEGGGPPGRRTQGGAFGSLTWERWSWLWEVDATRLLIPHVRVKTKLLTTHELAYEVRQGLAIVGNYNWVDRNLDEQTGTKQRAGVGVDVNPVPCVEFQAQLNRYIATGRVPGQNPPDLYEPSYWRSEVQVHLFY